MPLTVFFVKLLGKIACYLLFLSFSISSFSQENCSNSKDDDRDGLIDLQDPDCHCELKTTINLLKNPSFEQYDRCPTYRWYDDSTTINDWKFGIVLGWLVGMYYNYSCQGDSAFVASNLPIPSLPLPDGKGFVMINQATSNRPDFQEKDAYKCYIGQCLQQPLIKGDDYTFTFYTGFGKTNPRSDSKSAQPFRVGIYGHTDCSAIPFGKINVGSGCPLNYEGWVQLGVAIVKGNENWVPVSVKLTITKNINALLIGPDCTIVSPGADDFNSAQNYLDKLQLSETINFNFKKILIQNGNACIGTYTLKAPFIDGATYQWYKDSIAISGATGSLYHVAQFNGSGFYNVRISRGNNCETTDALHIPFSKLVSLYIPADTFICKNEILEIASSVNGILYEWNGGNSDSVIKVVQPGSYNIVAYDTNGCRRPFVVNVRYQDCDKCTIYMPNAFTPNNDGLNDILRGSANCSIDDYSFQIYNRWGQKVFESNTIINGWDGTHNNKPLPGGAYIYVVRFKNSSFEAKYKLLKGYVNLIR